MKGVPLYVESLCHHLFSVFHTVSPRPVCFVCSVCGQPRGGTLQGSDERLQQERSAHGEERGHHSGPHQADAHKPHLPGGWSSVLVIVISACQGCTGLWVNSVSGTRSPQNEKEEALMTSVWIEMVTTYTFTTHLLDLFSAALQGWWLLSWYICKTWFKKSNSQYFCM